MQNLAKIIPIGERAILDFHYKREFESRFVALEAGAADMALRISTLETVSQQVLSFYATASQTLLTLPLEARSGFTPVVAVGGVMQAWGTDYTTPNPDQILFSEPLIKDEPITVVLTY